MMSNTPSSSEPVSPTQKWIGAGLIGLVLVGLIVAFAGSPAHPGVGRATTATTTTLNADIGGGADMVSTDVPPRAAPHPKVGTTGSVSPRLAVVRPALQQKPGAIPNEQFSGATPRSAVELEASADVGQAHHLLTEANAGQVVRLKVGQRVAIRLKENRTTGYGWQLESPNDASKQGLEAVPQHLELLHDKSRKGVAVSASGKPLVGAPGVHEWVLRAASVGQSEVCATYRRPWQKATTTAPAQQYCVKLDVTN